MNTANDILFSCIAGAGGEVGQIVLNRPNALNSLTADMCDALKTKLTEWEHDHDIKAVTIKGAGDRAFCAGGDVRKLFAEEQHHVALDESFFWKEYSMNAAVFHFSKPYIAFLDGITMGGGAGVSIHGSHRVATERLVFAMPETAIGFYPDIGAGHFLNRCPDHTGRYLGLTGKRINATDAHQLGLANFIVSSVDLEKIENEIIRTKFSPHEHEIVTDIIQRHDNNPAASELTPYLEHINHCFAENSIEVVMLELERLNNDWANTILNTLNARSPTSLKVTNEYLQRSKNMSFNDIIKLDFDIANNFLQSHDFYEGVRAALIDKDQSPRWQPQYIDEIDATLVTTYFQPAAKRLHLK